MCTCQRLFHFGSRFRCFVLHVCTQPIGCKCFVVNTHEPPQFLSGHALSSRLYPLTKVQVSRSLLPTSLLEHLSMGQDRNPPTQWTTSSAWSVLSWPWWPCCYRTCVVAERLDCRHRVALAARYGHSTSDCRTKRTVQNNLTSTMAIIVHSKRLCSVSVTARSFRPARQPCRNKCTPQILNFIDSREASITSRTRVMKSLDDFCAT